MSQVTLRAAMRVAAMVALILIGIAFAAPPARAAEEPVLTFSAMSTEAVGFPGEPSHYTTGDFDGDGAVDLALKGWLGTWFPGLDVPPWERKPEYGLTLLLGDGGGAFSPDATFYAGLYGFPMVGADLDGDGRSELLNASQQGVSILSRRSGGRLIETVIESAPPGPTGLGAADADGDGDLDVVVAHGRSLSTFLGDGLGGLAPGMSLETSYPADGLAPTDLNGDGAIDLVAVSVGDAKGVSTFLNDGAGHFASAERVDLPGTLVGRRILTGDFDADGSADVVVGEAYPFGSGPFSMPDWRWSVLLGDGEGGLMWGPSRAVNGGGDAMAVADFDRDGCDDLAVGGYFELRVSVFRGMGAGAFAPPVLFDRYGFPSSRFPMVIQAADFDGDGLEDLWAQSLSYSDNENQVHPAGRWFMRNTTPSVDVSLRVLPGARRGMSGWYARTPSIALSATGAASIQYAWEADAFAAYASPLEAAEGTSTLRYYLVDDGGSAHGMGSRAFWVDTRPPAGTMSIAGPFVSPSRVVEIDSAVEDTVSGVSRMRFDVGAGWGSWMPYSAVTTLALAGDDGTQTVDAEYRDAAGNVMATSADVFYLRRSTSISLPSVTSAVSYGTSVVVSATAREVSGSPLPGLAGVLLEISTDGGATWPTSGPASYDPGSMSYEASTGPLRASSLCRFVFPGDDAYRASASAPQGIGVRAWLPRPVVPPRVGRGRPFTVYGLLKPRHGGHTALHLFRCVRGRWVRFAVVRAPHVGFGDYSRYGARCRVPYEGRWFVKAVHADRSHALTTSAPRLFVAR